MRFDKVSEDNKRDIYFAKNHVENEAGRVES